LQKGDDVLGLPGTDVGNILDQLRLVDGAQSMFAKVEADLRTELPDFSATNLVNSNVFQFYNNPERELATIDALSATLET